MGNNDAVYQDNIFSSYIAWFLFTLGIYVESQNVNRSRKRLLQLQ